jgi:hypothetical protein
LFLPQYLRRQSLKIFKCGRLKIACLQPSQPPPISFLKVAGTPENRVLLNQKL